MPAKHSHRLEHFTLHLLAILLLFSTFATSFLAFGVYQNETTNTPSIQVEAASQYSSYWDQVSWAGGTSGTNFSIPWGSIGTSGGWDKYTSASYVTANSSGIQRNDPDYVPEFVSTIFDAGTKRIASITPFASDNQNYVIWTRGGNSPAEVQAASWNSSGCPGNYRYVQYKFGNLPAIGHYINTVRFSSAFLSIGGTVKDASTNTAISNATVTLGSSSSTTSFLKNSPFLKTVNAAGGYYPGSYGINHTYDTSDTSYSITASATGYQSQTQTFSESSLALSECSYYGLINFSLQKNPTTNSTTPSSSSSPSTTSSNSSGTTKVVDTSPKLGIEEFNKIVIPAIFSKTKTTDPTKVLDHTKVKAFTIAIDDKNEIKFEEDLDLSSQNSIEKLKELDKYVDLDEPGKIVVDSVAIPALNKKAKLTMLGLAKYVAAPEILVDGRVDSKKTVGKVTFNKNKKSAEFSVSHFTTFTAIPKLELVSPSNTTLTSLKDLVIKVRVSDANAWVTGSFNGTPLAKLTPNKTTGEFTLNDLVLKNGKNELKLQAVSELGTITPLVAAITYNPNGLSVTKLTQNPLALTAFLVTALGTIVIALLLYFFVYRKRKRVEMGDKVEAKPTSSET